MLAAGTGGQADIERTIRQTALGLGLGFGIQGQRAGTVGGLARGQFQQTANPDGSFQLTGTFTTTS